MERGGGEVTVALRRRRIARAVFGVINFRHSICQTIFESAESAKNVTRDAKSQHCRGGGGGCFVEMASAAHLDKNGRVLPHVQG